LNYKAISEHGPVYGFGHTGMMSRRDIRFAAGDGLKPGMDAEIVVAWPRLLDDRIRLQLVLQVTITGSQDNVTEARIRAYDFRTLGTVSSSRLFKEDIQDMGHASSGLMRLRPVTFRYQKPFADGSKPMQYGLIAEEVAEVYPDLVAHSADGQIETVKYQVLDSMLLNEVQRLNKENQALRERLSRLEAAMASVTNGAGVQ
jgi:hypothetical protein